MYTAGLVNPLKTDVVLRRLQSLDDAIMTLGRRGERRARRVSGPGSRPNRAHQREAFDIDLYAFPLGEYDMVLGVQWLGTLGPILWHFAKHTMAFKRGDRRVLWHGVDTTPGPSAAALTGPGVDLMDALLEEFAGLFTEPQGLPPRRYLCHCIRLKSGVGAVAIRHYRYAHTQKDELERQCDEMMR